MLLLLLLRGRRRHAAELRLLTYLPQALVEGGETVVIRHRTVGTLAIARRHVVQRPIPLPATAAASTTLEVAAGAAAAAAVASIRGPASAAPEAAPPAPRRVVMVVLVVHAAGPATARVTRAVVVVVVFALGELIVIVVVVVIREEVAGISAVGGSSTATTTTVAILVVLALDAEHDLLADGSLEDEGGVGGEGKPALDAGGVLGTGALADGEHDERDRVLGVVYGVGGNGLDARGPEEAVLETPRRRDAPPHLRA